MCLSVCLSHRFKSLSATNNVRLIHSLTICGVADRSRNSNQDHNIFLHWMNHSIPLAIQSVPRNLWSRLFLNLTQCIGLLSCWSGVPSFNTARFSCCIGWESLVGRLNRNRSPSHYSPSTNYLYQLNLCRKSSGLAIFLMNSFPSIYILANLLNFKQI